MEITAAMVKELRDATGAGVLDCRKALQAHDGDLAAATEELRAKGLIQVAEKGERATPEGVVEVYGHPGNRVGVMLELNCETDFVARTPEFRAVAHDLALHIAFAAPRFIARTDVPEAQVESERATYRAQALEEGKPEHIVERIVEGKLDKFFHTICLLEQPFVKDEERTIDDVIKELIARLGENVVVRRFVRYELGEEL